VIEEPQTDQARPKQARVFSRRRFLQLGAMGALGFGGVSAAWSEGHAFGLSQHKVVLPGLVKPLRLIQLTDLHFGFWHGAEHVRRWVDATLKLEPDLIVLTGDLVDRLPSLEGLEHLASELQRLHAPLGVFAVLGNHDYWRGSGEVSTDDLVLKLEQAGLKFLNNVGVALRSDFFLAGIDDLLLGSPKLDLALTHLPAQGASILLAHNPDVLPDVPARVGLTLSGHTHGGQIRAPFGMGLYSISKYGERFQQGFVQGDLGARGFVSRGLGTGGLPLRTFCPAELVLLELNPA
jgi:uncharacterized protein